MSYEKQLCCQKIKVGFLDRGVCPEEGFVSREKRAGGWGSRMWQREMAAGAKVFGNHIINGTKELSLDLSCLLSSTSSDIFKHLSDSVI